MIDLAATKLGAVITTQGSIAAPIVKCWSFPSITISMDSRVGSR